MTKIILTKDVELKTSQKGTTYALINGYYSIKNEDGFENKFCSLLVFKNSVELINISKLLKKSKIEIDVKIENKPYTGKDGVERDSFSAMIFDKDKFEVLERIEEEKKSYEEEDGVFIDKVDEDEIPF